ncbi:MAG: LamG domain-containing protein, partial [Planctomycetota bacterium]|nr:LamG domain-containing protein [Planctomycetota bacterium]
RREVVYTLPHNALTGRACVIYAVRELGDKLLVVSGLRGRSATYVAGQGTMYADLFDRAGGAHLAGEELSGLACLDYPRTGYDTQAEILDRAVVVTGRDGVHVFSAAVGGAKELTVDRAAAPAAADGRLSDWQGAAQVPLAATDGAVGTLRLAHDRRRLYLNVTSPAGGSEPFRARGTFSGGHYVEVSLAGAAVSGRWLIGVDSQGLPAARDADGETAPDVTAARSFDALAGTVSYEISLPLPASLWSADNARRLRVGVRVETAGGPEPLAWRGEPAGKAERMLPICLNPFTHAGEEAAKALAAAGGAAGMAAAGLDRPADPQQAAAGKYLSQWVCIASGVRPTALAVGLLADGEWRYASWHDPTPPQALPRPWNERARLAWWAGPIPTQGNWVELRVPLSALGVADRAIEGVLFRTESPGRVLWDRTAVVFPGGERVLVEGTMPAGEPVGAWTWAADVSRAAVKAHEGPAVTIVDEPGTHGVILAAPFSDHAGTPPRRAVLTQWVFLDPAGPPSAVAIQLYDGRRWGEPWVWGQADAGVWAGPLPPAGAWTQLRIPLDRTPLTGEPITGIAFDQTDGRAVWGATAIQADGRSVDVITDKTPPMLGRAGRRIWGPGPRRVVGGVEPVEGKGGLAVHLDGRSGCIEVPDSPRLALNQFTVEGWVRIDPEASGTQWIAAKNEAAEGMTGFDLSVTDGHLRARVFGGPEGVATLTSARALVTAGLWHHVAMTWDGAALAAYVGGKSFEPTVVEPAPAKGLEPIGPVLAPTPANRPGPTALYFGRRSAGGWRLAVAPEEFHLRGALGGLHLYGRALSPAGVRAAAEAASGKLPRSLRQAMIGDCTFEDLLAPGDPGTAWEWVQREGKAGHTLRAGAPGAVHAAIDLIEPVTQHLGAERAAVVAAVEKALPAMGGGPEAWRLFDWMRRAEGGPAVARVDRLRWFLRTYPASPGAPEAAALLREALLDANLPPDANLAPAEPPRRTADAFIREWLVAGSWQNDPATRSGFAQLLEPELHLIDLTTRFAIVPAHVGQTRWRVMRSPTNLIDLRGEASNDQQAVMLAACFAYARQPRRVQFDVGCDDSMDIRVNRRLVHTLPPRPRLTPRDGSVEVVLPAGWSEILLKVGQGPGPTFGFTFEARDGATGGPLEDVTFSTTPPQGLP